MGDGARQVFQGIPLKEIDAKGGRDDPWVTVEGGGDGSDVSDSESSIGSSSFGEDSANSVGSSSSSDLMEDASSSASSASSSSLSNASLYDLSDLMEHLPIKRGLSKYFKGKSQSFTSLARVKSIEDLAKRVSSNAPCRKKIKACQSYGGGLDGQKLHSPKAAISKRVAKGYGLSSLGKRPPNLGVCRVPYPAQKT